jgi:hypothetical protein
MTLLSIVGVPEKEKYFSHSTSYTDIIFICSITMSVLVTLPVLINKFEHQFIFIDYIIIELTSLLILCSPRKIYMRNAAEEISSYISEIWFGLAISGKARQFMPLDGLFQFSRLSALRIVFVKIFND